MSFEEIRTPIFPLAGVVLFPDARQLLHIFEPRYRQMTEDALAGSGTIGMVLPSRTDAEDEDAEEERPREPVGVYPIGCLGRITASRKLPDGRFLIVLQGEQRFRILREEPVDRLYRVVVARPLREPAFRELPPEAQEALQSAREELEARLDQLIRRLDAETAQALRERMDGLDPIQLTHALASGLDCSPLEKQVLLEIDDPLARCRQLVALLDFHRAESQLPETPRTLN